MLTGAGVNRQYFHSGFAGYFSYYRVLTIEDCSGMSESTTARNSGTIMFEAKLRSHTPDFFLLRSFAPEYFMGFWGKHECIVIFRVILRLPCARVYI